MRAANALDAYKAEESAAWEIVTDSYQLLPDPAALGHPASGPGMGLQPCS